ncbi:MAG: hypothetical protein APF80_12100 [Alphaproteobacteria bacterium BRH_c36]|nr:MAG: hypothetical protein APF80_12100 [Alphaproteobacteria bacterium BRH_c36]
MSLLPTSRADDLVYFDPAHLARPIGFNPLAQLPEDDRLLVVENVVAAFHAIWPDFWGPRLEHILAHALRLLMDIPGGTLLSLPRLLQDQSYRAGCLRHVMILTSNRGFAEWGEVFGDHVVATALLDSLLHHAIVIQIEGSSYRLRQHADLVPENIRARPSVNPPQQTKRRGRPPGKKPADLENG